MKTSTALKQGARIKEVHGAILRWSENVQMNFTFIIFRNKRTDFIGREEQKEVSNPPPSQDLVFPHNQDWEHSVSLFINRFITKSPNRLGVSDVFSRTKIISLHISLFLYAKNNKSFINNTNCYVKLLLFHQM